MSNEQTAFDFDGAGFYVFSDGGVSIVTEYVTIKLSADEFKRLAEAQQNAVWAVRHWTSIAQVSDALASLLAVYPMVRVQRIDTGRDSESRLYYYASLVVHGEWREVWNIVQVQELFRQLNEQPAE